MTDDNTTHGGPVLSNDETIAALRQGVACGYRMGEVVVDDTFGETHTIPVAVVDTETETRVEVMTEVLAEVDKRAAGPRRRMGTVTLGALDSLCDYVNRYKGDHAVAFASTSPPGVTVVFDYHPSGPALAAWAGDRVAFPCPTARQWDHWTALDGRAFTQAAFGDLIEQHADDLRGDEKAGLASAARMLEVARNLVIHTSGKFERRINPNTGEGTLIVSDDHGANSTKIPRGFGLAIPVFAGSPDLYPIECRLRFSMVENRPAFAFTLHNRQAVFDHALAEVRKAVADRCGIPVFVGAAPYGSGTTFAAQWVVTSTK